MKKMIIHNNEGQILLIGLMLVALVTTIVGTGALRTVTSTRTTKQAEEGNKASNIAKGILEGFLNNETINSSEFIDSDQDVTRGDVLSPTGQTFVSNEVIKKDSTHMFYTAGYNSTDNTFNAPYYSNDLVIFFGSGDFGATPDCAALEITTITISQQVGSRSYVYSCEPNPISGGSTTTKAADCPSPCQIQNTTFKYTKTINTNGTLAVLVRPLFGDTKIGYQAPTGDLPVQGREISSTARTIDGAQKTEKAYQAYPQIPLNFFTTTF